MITQKLLKRLFYYENGRLLWKNGRKRGSNKDARPLIIINKKKYFEHRLVWLYFHGELYNNWYVIHRNGISNDNRIENLCIARNFVDASQRKKANKRNKFNLVGVSKCRNKYRASITLNYKIYHLGLYNTPEDAHKAYLTAKEIMHSFYEKTKLAD